MRSTIFGLVLIIATQLSAATPEQSYRQIIPAVAHTEGVGGSLWRTDLVIYNPSDRAAIVTLTLLPSGIEGGGVLHSVRLPPLESMQTRSLWDVGTVIPGLAPGTGALVIEARDAEGLPVPIVVDSRTWNPASGSVGSYGQGIQAVAWSQDGALAGQERRVLDLESSDDFRTNLGIVNPTGSIEETFLVEILDAGGEEMGSVYYRLGPGAHIQRNDILRELGLEGSGYTAVVRRTRAETVGGGTTSEAPDFVVYGSKVDQRSNDPTYLVSQAETTQSGLPKHRVVPAAAKTDGADGSSWQTDVTIHSAGGAGVTAMVVELIPTGGVGIGSGSPERYVATISGGQTKALDDIIGSRFDDHEVAALVVQGLVGGGGSPDLRVSSRTWTPTGDGEATMGQGIPGIPRRSVADPMVIPGLEASDEFRTNIGLVNPSQNMREMLNITFYDASGVARGGTDVILEPWSHIQLDSILDTIGLEGREITAVVTMTESENLMYRPSESWEPIFMAYGSRIDRVTNDPTFI